VSEAVAMLCAREKTAQVQRNPDDVMTSLTSGCRVRVLPDAGVYEFGGLGNDGFWLAPLDVKHKRTAARFWVPKSEARRLEPTIRKRPMGEANRKNWRHISPTPWDIFTGLPTYGNAALTGLAVILVGQKAELREALEQDLGFAGTAGELSRLISDGLPWGDVDEEGEVRLLSPHGAYGTPLIVVARDHLSARRLAAGHPANSICVISARPDDALSDRTSVEAIAERQRFLLIGTGRHRQEFVARRQDGWTVVELSGGATAAGGVSGIAAIDRVAQTSLWMQSAPGVLAQPNRELELAFSALDTFSKATEAHAESDEDVADTLRMLRTDFFDASDWLGTPTVEDRQHLAETCERTAQLLRRLRSVAGADAAEAAAKLIDALATFSRNMAERTATPKGEYLLQLAIGAQKNARFQQLVAVGHGQTVKAVMAFLDANGCPMTCVTPGELARIEPVDRVNVLSMMRRDAFARLVDPWAAPRMMFVGYQHEVDVYRRRLAARETAISRLSVDDGVARRFPSLAGWTRKLAPTPANEETEIDEPLAPVARPVRQPQPVRPGDALRTARFCRFAGNSWMAVTEEHSFARVHEDAVKGAQVTSVEGRDLQVGDLILVREGSDKDIVRETAEMRIGREKYAELRQRAGLWNQALKLSRLAPDKLRGLMAEQGLDRGLPTIRWWLSDLGPIGPSDAQTSVPQIASALGNDPASAPWKACVDAIQTVRSLHVEAGFRLTQMLLAECGQSVLEHSEHETPFEMTMGTVWLLEVQQLDARRPDWPAGQVNRLIWESDIWRRRILARNQRAEALDLDIDLDELLAQIGEELAS